MTLISTSEVYKFNFNSASYGSTLMIAWIIWNILRCIHRLYYHPLRNVPGPRLAALTFWYETYYEVVQPARYTWKIGELHEQYKSPIIRINPDEIHINDPEYFDTVYSQRRRVEKPPKSADSFGPVPGIFGTVDHDLHRMRRAPLNKHFSKKFVSDLQPWILSSIEKLCERLEKAKKAGKTVNLKYAYAAVARDIIDEYCFSRQMNSVLLEDFNEEYTEALDAGHDMTPIFIQFRWLGYLLHALPGSLTKMLDQGFGKLLDEMESVSQQIETMRTGKCETNKYFDHPTVLRDLLESDMPEAEKAKDRIKAEAQTLIGAGTSTVAVVLTTTTCHLIANPDKQQKLFKELLTAMPNTLTPLPLQDLERLPYLTAVILEGHRLSHVSSHRLPRVFTSDTLTYASYTIPAGTTVSMTPLLMHENSSVFPFPHEFRPERWLGDKGTKLKRFLVPFAKGTRQCIGLNLANAELYMVLGMVFRRFAFEFEGVVKERDWTVSRDTVIGSMRKDSKGVIVRVKEAGDRLSNGVEV
ncbi:MAG: hypothetical protein M1820_002956 [Bogoriella megaspora]|nr:MAG: hypothetical protein M1820_002956 [Bogoriella megaspora]